MNPYAAPAFIDIDEGGFFTLVLCTEVPGHGTVRTVVKPFSALASVLIADAPVGSWQRFSQAPGSIAFTHEGRAWRIAYAWRPRYTTTIAIDGEVVAEGVHDAAAARHRTMVLVLVAIGVAVAFGAAIIEFALGRMR